MKEFESFFSVLFILSPIVGFIPQIYNRHIIFPEILSSLTILANILKILHLHSKSTMYSIIPMQGFFAILLHIGLILCNKSIYSVTEEKIMKRLKITSKRVLFSYIAIIGVTIQLLSTLMRSKEILGILSLVCEISVNSLQLLIDKQNKDILIHDEKKKIQSQRELYLVWIVGDICRILFMMSVRTPHVYTLASFVQLGIDGYLLFN